MSVGDLYGQAFYEWVKERFDKDIENHKIEVLHDDGLYRHLRFSQGSFLYHFDLVTWPGWLAITGDMGSFTFTRMHDMFEFFRLGSRSMPDFHYWAEKVPNPRGDTRLGPGEEFSPGLYRKAIEEAVAEAIEEMVADLYDAEEYFGEEGMDEVHPHEVEAAQAAALRVEEFRRDVQWELLSDMPRTTDEAIRRLDEYSMPNDDPLEDSVYLFEEPWELALTDYSMPFVWCCFAIAWGIGQYDAIKAQHMEAMGL